MKGGRPLDFVFFEEFLFLEKLKDDLLLGVAFILGE